MKVKRVSSQKIHYNQVSSGLEKSASMIVLIDASIVNYYSLFYPSQAYNENVLSPHQPITFINLLTHKHLGLHPQKTLLSHLLPEMSIFKDNIA